MARKRETVRELVERLWAEGVETREIARRAGWSTNCPPTTYIAVYRKKGWNLPHRYGEDRVRAFRRARWPAKTTAP
jgi:transposase